MVKVGNAPIRPKPKPIPPPIVDETELTRAIKADWKRRNGGKSPDAVEAEDQEDDAWSQDSNRYQQNPMPVDIRKPLLGLSTSNGVD